MGLIHFEVLICDFCGKRIGDPADGLRRELTLRRPHAKGLGRCVEIVLHEVCEGKLLRHATRP